MSMLERTRLSAATARKAPPAERQPDPLYALRVLLTGGAGDASPELPALPDLVAAVSSLAAGTRAKVMLPLGGLPAEYALVRRGDDVLVYAYGTDQIPEVYLHGRSVKLRELLAACAGACRALSLTALESTTGSAFERLATRVAATPVEPDAWATREPVRFSGGTIGSPGIDVPLAFGFHAQVMPSADTAQDAASFADAQALLFTGRLWAFSRGRRFVLLEGGAIMLAAQRMVASVRALVDAWQASRGANVRLNGDGFSVGVRHARDGEVSLMLTTQGGGSLTLPALDVASASLPILRLASDLVRKLVAVDRRQAQNLRLLELKREVRALRRVIRNRERLESFENRDPDRLRLGAVSTAEVGDAFDDTSAPKRLRYAQRWSAEVDGLDASAIFFSGDRLVVATPKLTLALSRRDGSVVWSQPTARAASLLCGEVLVRALPDGELELCDLGDGSVFARTRFVTRGPGALDGLYAGGGALPPMAILVEGRQRIVAIDLRTGQARWDFRVRGAGTFQMRRAGRVLLVASGDASLHALDVATGEVVWRFSDRVRFCLAPAVVGESVVAAAGEPGGGGGAAYGIDLYSGRLAWTRELPAAPSGEPVGAGNIAVIGHGRARNARITGLDARDGRRAWTLADPGFDQGGNVSSHDGSLVVNAPSGRVSCLDIERGQARWTRSLANPLTDDVPRQLDPVLRQGALFIPSAQLHVLRPNDGEPLTTIDCDLVPDFLHVDEQNHVFVAEESGHLRAYAPLPELRLVR